MCKSADAHHDLNCWGLGDVMLTADMQPLEVLSLLEGLKLKQKSRAWLADDVVVKLSRKDGGDIHKECSAWAKALKLGIQHYYAPILAAGVFWLVMERVDVVASEVGFYGFYDFLCELERLDGDVHAGNVGKRHNGDWVLIDYEYPLERTLER